MILDMVEENYGAKNNKKLISKTMYFLDEYKTNNVNVLEKVSITQDASNVFESVHAMIFLEYKSIIRQV